MIETILKVYENRKLTCNKDLIIGNKWEDNVQKIKFEVANDTMKFSNGYKYAFLTNPKDNKDYAYPLTEDNVLYIDTSITQIPGVWKIKYVVTSQEYDDNMVLQNTSYVFCSNTINMNVNVGIEPSNVEPSQLPTNVEIVYDKMLAIIKIIEPLLKDVEEIDDYVEVQEKLNIITTLCNEIKVAITNINVSVTVDFSEVLEEIAKIPTNDYTSDLQAISDKLDNLNVDVDLTPVMDKLDELDTICKAIPTNDYTQQLNTLMSMVGNMSNDVGNTYNMVMMMTKNINALLENSYNVKMTIDIMNNNIGDDTHADGTLWHDAYWALQRAEGANTQATQANTNTQTIINQLNGLDTILGGI